ncbi:MAG: NAD(P) transhydrogenase subunit alpha [Lentisphaerae bacterium]|nr:NAD(P) transhydrogenase subunit alpha [Lentisphaerota bacterium]
MKFSGLTLGVPREIMPQEARVAALPETVRSMVGEGARVLVEAGAGVGCDVADADYAAAGAAMVSDPAAIYAAADVILKVKEPQFNQAAGRHEVEMMHAGQVLITFLHPAAPGNHAMIRKLAAQGVTALTLDGIPRISRAQTMDALTSMSTVAGYKSVLMAANLLKSFVPLIGTAVGMMPPAQILVVGAGVAGLQAIATAKRLGGVVTASDIRPQALEQAGSLGAKVLDTGVPAQEATGAGGYARALSEAWLEREREALRPAVKAADIVILAALIPGQVAPVLVDRAMVGAMRPGSVVVDIAVDQGGNCACTQPGQTAVVDGVTLVGIKNIPGQIPRSSTWMFARNIYNLLAYLAADGALPLDGADEIVASTLVTRGGEVVHAGALAAMAAKAEASR